MTVAVNLTHCQTGFTRPEVTLRPGIRVFSAVVGDAVNDRIALSDGIAPAPRQGPIPYAPYAWLPKGPWRAPSPVEAEMLWAPSCSSEAHEYVGVIGIPADIIAPFRQLGLADVPSEVEFHRLLATPPAKVAIDQTAAYVQRYRVRNEAFPKPCVILSAPGLPVVTLDRSERRYIGLHLDSWDEQPLARRATATNRICINLGLEDRFFLMVNQPVAEICRWLDNGVDAADAERVLDLPATELVLRYLERFTSYPVVRIRVRPGEAYIAPTENIIHDGSAVGKRFPDVQLTVRGYFHAETAHGHHQ